MKKTLKRITALLLAFVMVAQILSFEFAYAEDTSLEVLDVASEATGDEVVVDSDDYIKVTASTKNGGFIIQTKDGDVLEKDDDNKYLLYPDENYKDYIFGREYGFLGLSSKMVSTTVTDSTIVSVWQLNDFTFTQTLTVLNTENTASGMVEISYQVENASDEDYQIEARILLDSALGDQDYAYYEIPNEDTSISQYTTIESEMILDNTDSAAYENAFFGYDDLTDPSITAYTVNANVGTETIIPTAIAFGHWNSLASTVFDFTPTEDLYFTNQYNLQYQTADSAYALYFDFGTVEADGGTSTIATNYGVYSNHTNAYSTDATVNFTQVAPIMELVTDDDGELLADVDGNYSYTDDGEFDITFQIQNISDSDLSDVSIEYTLQAGVYYEEDGYQYSSTTVSVGRINSQGSAVESITLSATADNAITDYRSIYIKVYEGSTLIAEKETYVLCPGIGSDGIAVNSVTPEIIYNTDERNLYLSVTGVGALKDTGAYSVIMTHNETGETVVVDPSDVYISSYSDSMTLTFDEDMTLGQWSIEMDFNDDSIEDITSDKLTFMVSDDQKYMQNTYGIITVERLGTTGTDRTTYTLKVYESQEEYDALNTDQDNLTLLEFKGIFQIEEGTKDNPEKIIGVSDELLDGTIQNTMVISNCLDIEDGTLTIYDVDGEIKVDIDAMVYTTGARTKVWNGVCALTTITDGESVELLQYDYMGNVLGDDVDEAGNTLSNSTAITLIWPTSTGQTNILQTVAGVMLNFRYAQFGQLAMDEDGDESVRVIAFGAQLDTEVLVPSSFNLSNDEQSAMDAEYEKLTTSSANPYYDADDLREVNEDYSDSQSAFEELANMSLGLYVHDILYGGGFIGFNISVNVGIPSFADGLPGIEGEFNLKVINQEWEFAVEGEADLGVFSMEGSLELRSYNSIPVLDTVYFFAGGFTPGINVDGFGIFWIKGAGGGISELYETIFMTSTIPPLTLLIKGQFAVLSVLSATAEVSVSLQGISGALSDVGLSSGGVELNFLERVEITATWYPDLTLYGGISLNVFDIVTGTGYLAAEVDEELGRYFYEGYARADVKIPSDIPIIGDLELSGIGVGLNTDRVWGAINIWDIDFALCYDWGDAGVSIDMGSSAAVEPTYDLLSATTDTSSSVALLSVTNSIVKLVDETSSDSYAHSLSVLDYFENKDVLATLTFNADSDDDAKYYASQMTITNADGGTKTLTWDLDLDNEVDEDANASLKANSDGTYTAIFSFTTASEFGKTWLISMPVNSTLEYYEIERLASIDKVTLNTADDYDNYSVTVTGDLDEMATISVYAEQDDAVYLLAEAENLSGTSATIDFVIPQNLPTGDYTITVVGKSADETSNPIVEADETFSYVNPNQPDAPKITSASLGGDYTIDVEFEEDEDCDGYYVSVYEVVDGEYVATDIADVQYDKSTYDETIFPVGGQYVYTSEDDDGNVVEEIFGLEAGKTYVVGLIAYKSIEVDGYEGTTIAVKSEEAYSSKITMVDPVETTVTLTLEDAKNLTSAVMPTDGTTDYEYPTTTSEDVTITVSSDQVLSSGQYKIDGEDYVDYDISSGTIILEGLESGMHTLYFMGENYQGDAVQEIFVFNVDNVAPTLLISTTTQGFFNQEDGEVITNLDDVEVEYTTIGDTLTIKGESEEGAIIHVTVEGEETTTYTVGSSGTFDIDVELDISLAYQYVQIWAEDSSGNVSKTVSMPFVNSKLAASKANYAIYLDGEDVTDGAILTSGTLSLVSIADDGTAITINDSSLVLANEIEWDVSVWQGTAYVTDSKLEIGDGTMGLLTVTMDEHVITASLGEVSTDTLAADAYSVEVYWGAMEFTFTDAYVGEWNVETHEYEDAIDSSWEASGNTVTVKNMSSKDVVASFSYVSGSDFTDIIGAFDTVYSVLESCQYLAVGEEDQVVSTLNLTGSLSDEVEESDSVKIGTVTVSISVPDTDDRSSE